MKWVLGFHLLAVALALGHENEGDDENSTSRLPTLVWVTTTVNGGLATVQVQYTQSFQPVASSAAVVPLGTMGLGTISGEVGTDRTYDTTTLSGAGAAPMVWGGLAVMIGGFLL